MKPNEIRAALKLENKKQSEIAESFNPPVSNAAVTRVIDHKSKSRRIRARIAKFIKRDYEEVWPEAA
jgi:hypothetical protein